MGEFYHQSSRGYYSVSVCYTLTVPEGNTNESLPESVVFTIVEMVGYGTTGERKPPGSVPMTVTIRRLPDSTSLIGRTTTLFVPRSDGRRMWDEYIEGGMVPVLDINGNVLAKKTTTTLTGTIDNDDKDYNSYDTLYALKA